MTSNLEDSKIKSFSKLLIHIMLILYFINPKISYSNVQFEKIDFPWIKLIMVTGLFYAIGKYAYDKSNSDGHTFSKYTSADSSYLALKYIVYSSLIGVLIPSFGSLGQSTNHCLYFFDLKRCWPLAWPYALFTLGGTGNVKLTIGFFCTIQQFLDSHR